MGGIHSLSGISDGPLCWFMAERPNRQNVPGDRYLQRDGRFDAPSGPRRQRQAGGRGRDDAHLLLPSFDGPQYIYIASRVLFDPPVLFRNGNNQWACNGDRRSWTHNVRSGGLCNGFVRFRTSDNDSPIARRLVDHTRLSSRLPGFGRDRMTEG